MILKDILKPSRNKQQLTSTNCFRQQEKKFILKVSFEWKNEIHSQSRVSGFFLIAQCFEGPSMLEHLSELHFSYG